MARLAIRVNLGRVQTNLIDTKLLNNSKVAISSVRYLCEI